MSSGEPVGNPVKEGLPTICVSLDLETTGLSSERDAIIEVGAVKFEGDVVLDTFQTLVNPYRELPQFVERLTGILQKSLDRAPPFAAVAGELEDFVGSFPIIGHNISFDLGFLATHGLQLHNDSYDTLELATILLPRSTSYTLSNVLAQFEGAPVQSHRALADAQAAHKVFVRLVERAGELDPTVLNHMRLLAHRGRSPLGSLFDTLVSRSGTGASTMSMTGLDMEALGKRLGRARKGIRLDRDGVLLDEQELEGYFGPDGLLSHSFPGFEHRVEQVKMMRTVASGFNEGNHRIVEGGTGVGKSLAYLLPALLYALRNGTRVVVSTNTINLQEQLLQKDIPALVAVLEADGVIPRDEFKAVPLKGRANYLCLRRWSQLARSEDLGPEEARILNKTLVWLQDTASGDRGEINLLGKEAAAWNRISAGEKGQCPGVRGDGPCFLRAARDRAEGAHMLVVNHALLLSDLAMGGGLLPEYQHLIVDEAHHLEEEATRQLGFQVSQSSLTDEIDSLARSLADLRVLLMSRSPSGAQKQRSEELLAQMESRWPRRVKDAWDRLWVTAERFFNNHREETGDQEDLRITRSTRAQPGWSELEICWENLDAVLSEGITHSERLESFLETVSLGEDSDVETLLSRLFAHRENLEELRGSLSSVLGGVGDEQRVDWISQTQEGRGDQSPRSHMVLHSAPLSVGPILEERLFSRKSSVILTSATLSTQGSFDYVRERVGLADADEMLVGSPFDYKRAAVVLVPEDIPMPDAWGYQQTLEQVVAATGKALEGRTLVLFTSHAALRGTARGVRGLLEAEGIRVLAQGLDGSPRQILQTFAEDPKAVILGTASFWEGVDLSGGVLNAVIIARLPFHVPSEPVFAARSAEYEDPFYRYALPQAVLRFRQGAGRLIRGSDDRGAIVVLDKRIISRKYGRAFLDSLPRCDVVRGPAAAIADRAGAWVRTGR